MNCEREWNMSVNVRWFEVTFMVWLMACAIGAACYIPKTYFLPVVILTTSATLMGRMLYRVTGR